MMESYDVPRRQARPTHRVSAVTPVDNHLDIQPYIWGFVNPGGKKIVYNTRIESIIRGAPMWQSAFESGRCVLPVASFFESHQIEVVRNLDTGRLIRRQYEFVSPDREPILLASIHEEERLSIVTTTPNDVDKDAFARMPLVLAFEEVPLWIDGDIDALGSRERMALESAPERKDQVVKAPQLSLF